jgi:preprotein translocase subunit SecD
MGKIAAILLLSILLLTGCRSPSAPSVFQMRLVVTSASSDSEEMVLTNKTSVEKFQVQKTSLLDASAIEEADAIAQGGNNYISVKFTDSGAKKIEQATSLHVGEKLAIIISGKLTSAPTIIAPINGPRAQISGDFSRSEAKNLARKINQAVVK